MVCSRRPCTDYLFRFAVGGLGVGFEVKKISGLKKLSQARISGVVAATNAPTFNKTVAQNAH
jgi:hypothetical protein